MRNAKLLLFADDIKLYLKIQSEDDCALMQEDVSRISNWCSCKFVLVNPDKSKVLSMCRERGRISHQYFIGNSTIERVKQVRDLGAYFDSNLTFLYHATQIVASAFRTMGMITRLMHGFLNIMCVVCCSSVWNSLTITDATRIERAQKRFICLVYDNIYRKQGI